MQNANIKAGIAIALSALIAVAGFYGNYLPFRKSQLYIQSTREAQGAKTLVDFEKAMSLSLDAASPIGQNELVRNVAGMILSIIGGAEGNTPLVDASLKYITDYYAPIIERDRGLSFEQDLYILGLLHQKAFVITRNVSYLESAIAYYEKGYARGPKRPQSLYGLFDVYRMTGNVAQVDRVASQILEQWPNDDAIRNAYEKFKAQGKATNVTNR
jgi:hypothetical protein